MNGAQPLRIGVVGAGFVAQVAHLHSFSNVPDVEIVALAESHDQLRDAVADRYRVLKRSRDYHDLLDDPEVDAVVVSLPRHAQAIVVEDALKAKAAVLSEKPLAMTVAEAERLVGVSRRKGRLWAIGYMKRYDPGVVLFRDVLANARTDGRWGHILDVTMRDFCATYGAPAPAHVRRSGPRPVRLAESARTPDFVAQHQARDYEYSVNVLSHDINLLRWLFAEDLSVRSFTVRCGGAQQACFDTGGFRVTVTAGPADLGFWDQRLDVTFERARLSLTLPSPMARQDTARTTVQQRSGTEEHVVPAQQRRCAFEAQAYAFTAAVREGIAPASTGEDSLADMALIEGLWRTADWHQ